MYIAMPGMLHSRGGYGSGKASGVLVVIFPLRHAACGLIAKWGIVWYPGIMAASPAAVSSSGTDTGPAARRGVESAVRFVYMPHGEGGSAH